VHRSLASTPSARTSPPNAAAAATRERERGSLAATDYRSLGPALDAGELGDDRRYVGLAAMLMPPQYAPLARTE
jgi:hypothetical protein